MKAKDAMTKSTVVKEASVERAKRFAELLNAGLGKVVEACKLYVAAIDDDPDAKAYFRATIKIPDSAWARFEAVGRGMMHQRLLTAGGAMFERVASLSPSEQRKAIESGVPVLTGDDPKRDYRIVAADDMTAGMIRQAFAKGHIRTPEEQRVYLLNRRKAQVKGSPQPYTVHKDRVVFHTEQEYTAKDLQRILLEIMG